MGGYVRPETLRTAPHRRIVMVVGLNKKMGKSKKSALTVKQFSVTTWSLTNRKTKIMFFYFFDKKSLFYPFELES